MLNPTPPDLLAAFAAERDRRLISLPLRMPDRTRGLIARESDGLCVFCGNPGMTLARLVPHGSGGPSRVPNLIYSCRACHKRRNQGEWDALELALLNGRQLAPALASQRMDALALCPQHPVPPAARRNLADCRAYLAATRWVHPRVPFLVSTAGDRVLVAALQVPMGEAGASLLSEVREADGRCDHNGVWSIGRADWKALSWTLIEQHAVLHAVALGIEKESAESAYGSWRERWFVLYDDVADARRDAPRKPHRGFRAGMRYRAWAASQARRAG